MLEQDPPAPHSLNPAIPLDLETIASNACKRSRTGVTPRRRELAEDLNRFLAGEPIRARQISTSERYLRWARRNPVIAVLGGVLTAVLVLVTIASSLVAVGYSYLAGAERTARLKSDELAKAASLARDEAEKAQKAESKEKERAEKALLDALDQTYIATRNEVRAMRLPTKRDGGRARSNGLPDSCGSVTRVFVVKSFAPMPSVAWPNSMFASSRTFGPRDVGAWRIKFSPDGETLAVNDDKLSIVCLLDLKNNQELPSIPKGSGLAPFVFHPGAAHLLCRAHPDEWFTMP